MFSRCNIDFFTPILLYSFQTLPETVAVNRKKHLIMLPRMQQTFSLESLVVRESKTFLFASDPVGK